MSLSYRTGAAPGPDAAASAPAVILLHGYGADENDLAGLAPLLAPEGDWCSVRAPQRVPHGGSAWFPITTPGRPDPSVVEEATTTVWDWIDGALAADVPRPRSRHLRRGDRRRAGVPHRAGLTGR